MFSQSKDITITNDYYSLIEFCPILRGLNHIVIGKISDSGNTKSGKTYRYSELVQYAQEKYARTEQNVTIVRSTQRYNYYDSWHYDSNSYIDLGQKFAEAIYNLNQK